MNTSIGKKLSEMSIDEITSGMRVANAIHEEGIVRFTNQAKEIHVDWDNGSWTRYKEGDCGPVVIVETTDYSGKPLSQVPYDAITIGMDVISYIKNPGKVVSKEIEEHRDRHQWITVSWNNGKQSNGLHHDFDKVTVK